MIASEDFVVILYSTADIDLAGIERGGCWNHMFISVNIKANIKLDSYYLFMAW